MLRRGSLKQCIAFTYDRLSRNDWELLTIICAPRAKYYYVTTDEELAEREPTSEQSDHRIVFRGTYRELQQFTRSDQLGLWKDDNNAHN